MTDRRERRQSAPAILRNAFRPFFLGASLVAGLATPIWICVYLGWLPSSWSGLWLHPHELIYGFLAAMVCGFALTAIPNWTGRSPVAGLPLAGLFFLWLAGRVAPSPDMPVWLEVIDLSFLFVLAAIAAREVIAGRNWRNLPIVVLLSLFALSHLLFHTDDYSTAAVRGSLSVAALLIGLIGGRIVPSFTRNWMAARQMDKSDLPVPPMQRFDVFALAVLGLAMVAWLFIPDSTATGGALVLAGLLHLIRLTRWKGWHGLKEPLIWSMHAGYAWLGISALMLGLGALFPAQLPASAGLHALTSGAIACMGLAVMTRASLGHTGRPLLADGGIAAIYVMANLGAGLRVASALTGNSPALLVVAMVVWSAAFLLFVFRFAPMLFASRPDGR